MGPVTAENRELLEGQFHRVTREGDEDTMLVVLPWLYLATGFVVGVLFVLAVLFSTVGT